MRALPGRPSRLHAGLGLGEGAEPALAKAGVENQVGVVRERFLTPRLRVASYEELNAWLPDRCVAYAKAHKHPELADRTIWQAFEAERPQLVQTTGPFDGFHATQASVSKTCLVRFDNNKYSVASRAVGRPVEIQAYADRVVIRQEGAIVGEHRRRFGRGALLMAPPSSTGSCRPAWSARSVS